MTSPAAPASLDANVTPETISPDTPPNGKPVNPTNNTKSTFSGKLGPFKRAGITGLVAGGVNFTAAKASTLFLGRTLAFGPTLATGGIAGIIVLVVEVASYALKILGNFLAQNFPSDSGKKFINNSMKTVRDNKLANYAVKGLVVAGSAAAISVLSPIAGISLTVLTVAKIAGATFLVNQFVRPQVEKWFKI